MSRDDRTVSIRAVELSQWIKTLEAESRITTCPNSTAFVLRKLAELMRDVLLPAIDVAQFDYDPNEWIDDGGDSVRRMDSHSRPVPDRGAKPPQSLKKSPR